MPDNIDTPDAYDNECECTMCSGNCDKCEMEDVDVYATQSNSEREIDLLDQEMVDYDAENNYHKWRDRNEG